MRRRRDALLYHERFPVPHNAILERPSDDHDFQGELYLERLKHVLDQNTPELTPWESEILAQRFPSDHRRRRSLKEIGRAYGFSKERIRQIEKRVLTKIRRVLEEDPVLQ